MLGASFGGALDLLAQAGDHMHFHLRHQRKALHQGLRRGAEMGSGRAVVFQTSRLSVVKRAIFILDGMHIHALAELNSGAAAAVWLSDSS